MARKKLTPEDIKIHVDNICTFLENNKKHSEITKFNSRFPFLKNILINKKLIQSTIGKRNTIMYKHDKVFVLFPKDYEDILKEYQSVIKKNNERFFDNFLKTDRKNKGVSNDEIRKPITKEIFLNGFIENYKKEILEKEKNIESLKNSLEESGEKIIELTKLNKKYVSEYSAFINEKLFEIEQLKQELHKQQSQKNQISVIKVFGIPLIKKTTKTIK
jgi:hypothetical protein